MKYAGDFPIRHMNRFPKCQQWLFSKMQLPITRQVFHTLYQNYVSVTGGGFMQVHRRAGSVCAEPVPATRSFATGVQRKKEIRLSKVCVLNRTYRISQWISKVTCSKKLHHRAQKSHRVSIINRSGVAAESFIGFFNWYIHQASTASADPVWDGVLQLEVSQNNHRLLMWLIQQALSPPSVCTSVWETQG